MSTQLESLRRFVTQHPAPRVQPPAGGAVVVGGGKGGVGASLVAALLALGASRSARVLLVDGTAGFGSLHLLFGVEPGPGLDALRAPPADPAAGLVALTDSLWLLPAGSTTPGLAAAEHQSLLRRASSLFDGFGLAVVDGGSRMDSILAACGAAAARLLAVTTTDRIALTTTYALAKVVHQRFPALPVDVLVNRAGASEAEGAAQEVSAAALRFLQRRIGAAGAVPDDVSLRAAIEAGMNLCDAATGSPAAATLEEIGSTMMLSHSAGPRLAERRTLQTRS